MSDDTVRNLLIAVVALQATLMAIIIYFIVAGGVVIVQT